jgi:hypothetical protein
MLSACWRPSSTYEALPSWVPDWSNTSLCRAQPIALKNYIADIYVTQKGSKALTISARRIAGISRVDRNLPTQQGVPDVSLSNSVLPTQQELQRIKLFQNTTQQALSCKERWSPGEVDIAILDLSTGMSCTRHLFNEDEDDDDDDDDDEDEDDDNVADSLYRSYQAFQCLSTPPKDTSNPQTWLKDSSREYIYCVRDANVKNLFTTSTDLVGVTQDDVQSGDWVYVLGGVQGAWVLRKAEECCYRIVCAAYVFPWKGVEACDAPVEIISII